MNVDHDQPVRPLLWAASSKRDLLDMPPNVRSEFGHGLYEAQIGAFPTIGKPLSGFGGASVVELVMDLRGDTFRAVYTVKFKEVVIVLHAFQKKSKKGKETPKQDKELIHSRLKLAEDMYKEWKSKRGKNG
jgi:phage-related protein